MAAGLAGIDPMLLLRGVCLATGAALHIAPLPTMNEIKAARSTLNFHIAPYASTLLNHIINGYYAVSRDDKALMIHRTAGILANSYYVYTYLTYVPQSKLKDSRAWLVRVGVILLAMMCELHVVLGALGLKQLYFAKHLALFAAITGIGLAASPLATVGEVIRNRDSSSLPFGLCVMVTVQCTSWSIYGYLVKDWSTFANNIVGVVLGSIQLALIFALPNKRLQKKNEEAAGKKASPQLSATAPPAASVVAGILMDKTGRGGDIEAPDAAVAGSSGSGSLSAVGGGSTAGTGSAGEGTSALASSTGGAGGAASTGFAAPASAVSDPPASAPSLHLRAHPAAASGGGGGADGGEGGAGGGSGSGSGSAHLKVGTPV